MCLFNTPDCEKTLRQYTHLNLNPNISLMHLNLSASLGQFLQAVAFSPPAPTLGCSGSLLSFIEVVDVAH